MLCGGRCGLARCLATGLVALAEGLSYASINWIRFEGSPGRAITRRCWPLSPLTGAPLAGAKVVRVTPEVNHARDLC